MHSEPSSEVDQTALKYIGEDTGGRLKKAGEHGRSLENIEEGWRRLRKTREDAEQAERCELQEPSDLRV